MRRMTEQCKMYNDPKRSRRVYDVRAVIMVVGPAHMHRIYRFVFEIEAREFHQRHTHTHILFYYSKESLEMCRFFLCVFGFFQLRLPRVHAC